MNHTINMLMAILSYFHPMIRAFVARFEIYIAWHHITGFESEMAQYRATFRLGDGMFAESRPLYLHELYRSLKPYADNEDGCRVHSCRGFDRGILIGLEKV